MPNPARKPTTLRIRRYYQEFGSLFQEMTDGSAILNLGCTKKGQRFHRPREAQEQLVRMVLELGGFEKGMRALDVGCGVGGPAMFIAHRVGCVVVGMDPVAVHIEQASSIANRHGYSAACGGGVYFQCGDAMEIPFADGSFDRVYTIESAFHYSDKARFLRESARVLKKDGRLVIADIVRPPNRIESGPMRIVQKAVSAAHFFDKTSYAFEASRHGMRLFLEQDVTADVLRTFSLWRKTLWKKWNELRKAYSFRTLVVVGSGLWLIPSVVRFLSLKYEILVFCFAESVKQTRQRKKCSSNNG